MLFQVTALASMFLGLWGIVKGSDDDSTPIFGAGCVLVAVGFLLVFASVETTCDPRTLGEATYAYACH